MKYIFPSLFFVVFWISCSQNLDIPFPAHEPKLTLHAFLTPNEPIDLYLTHTYSILEEVEASEIAVLDAQVELWKNGQRIDNMIFVDTSYIDSSGFTLFSGTPYPQDTSQIFPHFYGAKYVPSQSLGPLQAGDLIRFVVSHPIFGEASAETQIPVPAEVQQIDLRRNALRFREAGEDNEQKWSSLDIRIKDPLGIGDYYNFYVGVQNDIETTLPDTTIIQSDLRWAWTASEVLSYPNGFSFGYNKSLADEDFDGRVHTHRWWYRFPKYFGTEPEYARLRVKAITLTEVYAHYLEKLNIQTDNRLSGIQGAFVPSESVVIPSNVKGGYGLVGSYNIAEDFIVELK